MQPGQERKAVLSDRAVLASHVKKALAGFHDPTHLQTSPLVGLLALQPAPGETTTMALRQSLREAVELLRPAGSIPFTRSEWFGYRILWMRYIQSRSQYDICNELGLGRTSFYRHHQEALDAVASILWERHRSAETMAATPITRGRDASAIEQARAEALRTARRSPCQPVSLASTIDGALRMVAPIAAQQGVRLRAKIGYSLLQTFGDPAILRQLFLNLFMGALSFAAEDELRLTVVSGDKETIWRLHGLDETRLEADGLFRTTEFVVSQALLEAYNGRLWLDVADDGARVVAFALPTARSRTILMIDDDDDTLVLHERYLRAGGYLVQVARSSAEVHHALAAAQPDLVILDVLMPQEDGWEILQSLKILPTTAAIPVLICSVLDQPGLALELGAADVLCKPITQAALLQRVQALLAPADSAG
ncbi:MAG: response regulator [Chloroflexi bacterium]|nr:response regulator [Chloroflexota bacterium]